MATTYLNLSTLPFIADVHTVVRNTGRQIDWATVALSDATKVSIPAGTLMAELASGMIVPLVDVPATETATCILESNASINDGELVGWDGYGCIVGGVLYENLLPEFGDVGFAAGITSIKAAGAGFVFETYSDSRG